MIRTRQLLVLSVIAVGLLAACGGDDPVGPDPALAPFVGTWDADSLSVTNGVIEIDLLEFGSFFINVQESGQYTATLYVLGQTNTEIGQLSVSGSSLTLTPSSPPGRSPATSGYVFASEGHLILDGPTEFDFNDDEVPEPATAHFELRRR